MEILLPILLLAFSMAFLFYASRFLKERVPKDTITHQGVKRLLVWAFTIVMPFVILAYYERGFQTTVQMIVFVLLNVIQVMLLYSSLESIRFRIRYDSKGFYYRSLFFREKYFTYSQVQSAISVGLRKKSMVEIRMESGERIYLSSDMVHTDDFLDYIGGSDV
ncbi:hypothetical protein [Guggenheimella bovis]